MYARRWLAKSVTVFAATLTTCAIVTLLWSRGASGAGIVDWETSFRFAIVFAIIIPWATAPTRTLT